MWLEGCVAHSAPLINIFQSNIRSILIPLNFFRNLKLALTERARCLLFFRSAGKSIFESSRGFGVYKLKTCVYKLKGAHAYLLGPELYF